jgi:hypothetical protein
MNNEKVEITKTTAETLLFHLTDYLYYIDSLDKETRAQVIALDELITALDYEDEHRSKVAEMEERNRKLNAEFHARQAEKAGE